MSPLGVGMRFPETFVETFPVPNEEGDGLQRGPTDTVEGQSGGASTPVCASRSKSRGGPRVTTGGAAGVTLGPEASPRASHSSVAIGPSGGGGRASGRRSRRTDPGLRRPW